MTSSLPNEFRHYRQARKSISTGLAKPRNGKTGVINRVLPILGLARPVEIPAGLTLGELMMTLCHQIYSMNKVTPGLICLGYFSANHVLTMLMTYPCIVK